MGEMAAMGEVHAEDLVSRAKHGEEDRHVGRRPGVGLHIRVFGAEELAGPLDGNALDGVHVAAAPIETPARIAFGILVRQKGPLRLKDILIDVVLGGDQDKVVLLHALSRF